LRHSGHSPITLSNIFYFDVYTSVGDEMGGLKKEAHGAGKEIAGGIKESVGKATGRHDIEARGKIEKFAGKVEKKVGEVERKL